MASKRGLRRKACDGKRRYTSQEQAEAVARDTANYNHRHNDYCFIAAYRCPFCNGWHVGHRG